MDNADNISPTDAGDSASAQAAQEQTLRFTGSGAEYFRIWAVNLTLTVLTLGLYGPWAKVRRLQYFYRHTELDGAVFDYVASPAAILFGRLLALVLFVFYYLSFEYSVQAGVVYVITLALALPYLLWQSSRFKARNTRFRGLSFGFEGSLKVAYHVYLPPILVAFAPTVVAALVLNPKSQFWVLLLSGLGFLALPLFHAMFRRYMQNNMRYGTTRFEFTGTTDDFATTWLLGWMLVLVGGLVIGVLAGIVMALIARVIFQSGQFSGAGAVGGVIFTFVLGYLLIGPYFTARFQKLVWEKTTLSGLGFRSDLTAKRLMAVQLRNTLGVILTLGLYRPFAAIRVARCRLESVTVTGIQCLSDFTVGAAQSRRGAIGESAGEFFEMDVGL